MNVPQHDLAILYFTKRINSSSIFTRRKEIVFCLIFFLFSFLSAQKWQLPDFVADTLIIHISTESDFSDQESSFSIRDNRENRGSELGIEEIKRWFVIPVDQYLVLEDSLSTVLRRYLASETLPSEQTLIIDNITIWQDSRPLFFKGRVLNGHTRLINKGEQTVYDWLWEFRLKKDKKENKEKGVRHLLLNWMEAQKDAMKNSVSINEIFPYSYRRQFVLWLDWILLQNGYILDSRLSLDFPADQLNSFIRSVPGIYYRRSSFHESIAIGGKDQQWYRRFSSTWLGRLDVTLRFGFNSFFTDKFDYLDFWNLFMMNMGITTSLEYRPLYLKGMFAGIGIHQVVNFLPEVISQFETGLLMTIGFVIP